MFKPLTSICIPAYKKPQYVVRCLDSILRQDYKNIQIIISDDSPGEDIKQILKPYEGQLDIAYYHNQPALKSPANWNAALDKASGELVMLMHQDDWFEVPDAVSTYVKAFEDDPGVDFVFCRNTGVDEQGKTMALQAIPGLLKDMAKRPNHLVRAQVIGPPSNTMLRKSVTVRYDEQLIWLVDVDYYARVLKAGHRYKYIDRHLVSIGLHEDQTTAYVRSNDHIILKENILFAAKLESTAFNDIKIYDYYWRLLRNHQVRSVSDIEKTGVPKEKVRSEILHMLKGQKKVSLGMLRVGPISKLLMTANYITK